MTIKRLLIASFCLVGFANLPTLSAQEKADVKVEKLDEKDNKATSKKKDKADNEFMSRLVVGLRLNASFPSNQNPGFSIGTYPMAAYRFTDFLRAGPVLGYTYYNFSSGGYNLNINTYGGGIFVDVRPLPMEQLGFISNIYIKGEVGYYQANYETNSPQLTSILSNYSTEVSKTLFGLGYSSNFGRGFSFQLEYLLNPFWGNRDGLVAPSSQEGRAAVMYGF